MTTIFDTILQQGVRQGIVPARTRAARDWYRDQAGKVTGNITPSRILNRAEETRKTTDMEYGLMYAFRYDPKMKKELPYYDTFPIVFPFSLTEDGFYGYNLHYLPLNYRAVFMDSIYGNNSTGSSKITTKLFEICTKRYILRNIKSKIAVIPEEEWELALFLPLQRFQKQSEGTVWSDSVSRLSERKV